MNHKFRLFGTYHSDTNKQTLFPRTSRFFSVILSMSLLLGNIYLVPAAEDVKDETAPIASAPDESASFADTAPEPEAQEESDQEIIHSAYYDSAIESNQWQNWPQGPSIEAQAAIVMDYYTGAVLYSKAADTQMYPASITKIMTALLACENNPLDDIVTTSENAVYNISEDSSRAWLEVGESLTMEQMLMCIMLQSANDAAYAVAEHTSGSMKKFVELMNQRAREIGCTGTHFNNPHGLHNENHYTTARDMALIMKTAWRNTRFRRFASTVTYEIPPTDLFKETRSYLNNHKMMKTEEYEYPGVLGGKTGFTDQAGNTLVTVAYKNSMALVVVVLNGINGAYSDTAALLDYGFENFKNYRIDSIVANDTLKTLPCDHFILNGGLWPSVRNPASNYYVTLPTDAKLRQMVSENKELSSSPCKGQILTNYYYYGNFVGSCLSYQEQILSTLLTEGVAKSSN